MAWWCVALMWGGDVIWWGPRFNSSLQQEAMSKCHFLEKHMKTQLMILSWLNFIMPTLAYTMHICIIYYIHLFIFNLFFIYYIHIPSNYTMKIMFWWFEVWTSYPPTPHIDLTTYLSIILFFFDFFPHPHLVSHTYILTRTKNHTKK